MAQRLAELCSILIENAYGELAAQIFSTLADYGRSTLIGLHQLTRIPLRRIKTGIASLIQHHILFHYALDGDSPTYFSIDWNTAYALVRTYKISRLVADKEGEAAANLVANVLQLGHASVGDLQDAYDLTPASKRDSGIDTVENHISEEGMINGIAKENHKHRINLDKLSTVPEFHSTLRSLLDKGYLIKVGHRSYTPRSDLDEQLRETVISEHFRDGRVTGPKKKLQFDAAVNTLKRKWEDEDAYSKTRDVVSRGVIKRSKAPTSNNKRVKLNGNLANGIDCHMSEAEDQHVGDSVPKLPNEMVVRVNVAKCTMILRTQRFERMVERFLGPVTAAVYGALLQSIGDDPKIEILPDKMKIDDEDSDDEDDMLPSATDRNVLSHLDQSVDLASTIKVTSYTHKMPNGVGNHRHKPHLVSDESDAVMLGIIKQETDSDNEDGDATVDISKPTKERNKRLQLLDTHLQVLAEHPKRFCIRRPGAIETRVNIHALTRTLIQAEIDTMVNARFGKIANRIVRMLREKGKLEEKQIATMSMMRIKDVRTVLTNLQFNGIVDVQELPKDARRQPSSTMYLWFFDERDVAKRYLQQTYQGMSRALQRVKVERDGKFKAVIEKAERTDVKGREQELLNWQEKELLKEWREIEERLLVQVGRMDDIVAVLRDFTGTDTRLGT